VSSLASSLDDRWAQGMGWEVPLARKKSGFQVRRFLRLDTIFGVTLTILCVGRLAFGDSDAWERAEMWVWLGFAVSWVSIQILALKYRKKGWGDIAEPDCRPGFWWLLIYDLALIALYAYLGRAH